MSCTPVLCNKLLAVQSPQDRERILAKAQQDVDSVRQLVDCGLGFLATAPDCALVCAGDAIELAERRSDAECLVNAWWVKARALRALSRHAEALEAFDTAIAQGETLGDRLLTTRIQMGRIDSLCLVGRYDDAIELARDLVVEFQSLGDVEREAKVLANLGSVYFRRDRYLEGAESFRRSLVLLAGTSDELTVAAIQQNYANVLAPLERIDEAIQYFSQARAVFDRHTDAAHTAMVDANVGFLYLLSGEYSPAIAALNRARQRFAEMGKDLETAKCDADLADVYRAVNLFSEAEVCYKRAIDVFERVPLDYERGRAEYGLAIVLLSQNRNDATFAALDRASTVFEAHGNAVQCAHVRLVRALANRENGDAEDVLIDAEAAMRTFARHRLLSWSAEAQMLLAEVAVEQGEDPRSRLRAVGRTARRYARGWLECRSECSLGDYYLMRNNIGRALRHFRKSVGVLEEVRTQVAPEELHVSFLRDKLAVYEKLVSALLRRGSQPDVEEAFEYVERSKSRLLLEKVQSVLDGRHNVASGVTGQARERLAALRAEMSRGYHRLHASDPETVRGVLVDKETRLEGLLDLEDEYRATLREIELGDEASAILVQSTVHSADLLCKKLGANEALVEYYAIDRQLCAFVLSKQGLKLYPALATLDTVADLARRLRYQLQKAGIAGGYAAEHDEQLQTGVRRVLRQLYDLLFRPLEAMLEVDHIVLVPYGVLHGLPLHALCRGTDFALDRWEFIYAPSAAVWYAGAHRRSHSGSDTMQAAMQSALIMGIPAPGIEHVRDEVEQLAARLPGAKVFCGTDATVDAFVRYAGKSGLIHLATHALFRDDNPLFSGLQFSDGWMLARDLYEQNLNCELATLSACRTGISRVEAGDELFGLMRGFLCAGARSLAVSLWPTDDAATAELMDLFYSQLAQRVPKAAALRAAQQQLRGVHSHPYHWAAFALVGDR